MQIDDYIKTYCLDRSLSSSHSWPHRSNHMKKCLLRGIVECYHCVNLYYCWYTPVNPNAFHLSFFVCFYGATLFDSFQPWENPWRILTSTAQFFANNMPPSDRPQLKPLCRQNSCLFIYFSPCANYLLVGHVFPLVVYTSSPLFSKLITSEVQSVRENANVAH